MSSATVLTELNGLSRSADGVFHKGTAEDFNYSDGQQVEQELYRILSSAEDLSSASPELESKIVDWPTEYHLSATRANLLRGLNLDGVKTVLELGCGCGAISRYLGEQPGLQVDSVEGSPVRASLAALRCRDLADVTITAGNFNEMEFPTDYYDLVLYVGVTEYAGRFSSRASDQEALQDLLALGMRCKTDNGTVLIAIENRTGLKYVMGASEDHYGVPYVGIDNYPQSTGIRTYTKAEWEAQIAGAGIDSARFVYSFPDYKVPTLLVDQACDMQNAALAAALGRIRSRDYSAPFDLGLQEPRLWQSVVQAGTLGEFTNSFMILLGNSAEKLKHLVDFDLIEFEHRATSPSLKSAPLPTAVDPIQELSHQIDELRQHSDHLQEKIDVMTKSRGWNLLNKIRAALGRSTIAK